MSGGLLSRGLMSGGILSGGLMSGGLLAQEVNVRGNIVRGVNVLEQCYFHLYLAKAVITVTANNW